MLEPTAAALIEQCGLPKAWREQPAWRILDTRFDRGLRFLGTWQAWKNDPRRPTLLHYVALTAAPVSLEALLASAALHPQWQGLTRELAAQWFGLLPGFHRLSLNDDSVLLTLCVGDSLALLRQQQFLADTVYLDPEPPDAASPWNIWTIKALARCCRRGSVLGGTAAASGWHPDLIQCGFELHSSAPPASTEASDPGLWRAHFNPRWTLRTSRHRSPGWEAPATSCAVVGAGLAGASVAAALARRGWQVQVLDRGEAPASGASGLPVGLLVPHASADDCALSRLSRAGVRLMQQQADQRLRQGQDWHACGTLERRLDGSAGLPSDWPEQGRDWSCKAADHTAALAWHETLDPLATGVPAIWHARGAWLKPATLVRAWLSLPGIRFQARASVAAVRWSGQDWELLDAHGQPLARASRVVLANANGALPLLEALRATLPALERGISALPAMQGVRGQLSWAMHADAPSVDFPAFPVNGAGSVIPWVPTEQGPAWFVGSSYEPDARPPLSDQELHLSNFGRLDRLLPGLAQALAGPFASGALHAWKNTRCVTSDRLPVVGPLSEGEQAGLWICAGMGSRGLSFAVLCAELLAAYWGAEPLPIEAGLARSLVALRGGAKTSAAAD